MERMGFATHLRQGYGVPSIEGKAATGSSDRVWATREFQLRRKNGANGICDMAGKAARVAVEHRGSDRDTMEQMGFATRKVWLMIRARRTNQG